MLEITQTAENTVVEKKFQSVTVIQPTEDYPHPRLVGLDVDGSVWVTRDITIGAKWVTLPLEVAE